MRRSARTAAAAAAAAAPQTAAAAIAAHSSSSSSSKPKSSSSLASPKSQHNKPQLLLALSLLLLAAAPLRPCAAARVVDLDDGTFDQLTRSGAWMIDIYAPGCIHCQKLEPTWRELANALEADGVRVAKIDGTRNRVLLMRFAVEGYPSIFLVRDGQAWQYQGSRTVPALRHFALSGHKASRPLPFHKSPVSAMGRTMGVLHSLPALARRAYAHFKDEKGFSDAAIIGGALAAPLALGGLAICALDAIYTRRAPPGVHDHYE